MSARDKLVTRRLGQGSAGQAKPGSQIVQLSALHVELASEEEVMETWSNG